MLAEKLAQRIGSRRSDRRDHLCDPAHSERGNTPPPRLRHILVDDVQRFEARHSNLGRFARSPAPFHIQFAAAPAAVTEQLLRLLQARARHKRRGERRRRESLGIHFVNAGRCVGEGDGCVALAFHGAPPPGRRSGDQCIGFAGMP